MKKIGCSLYHLDHFLYVMNFDWLVIFLIFIIMEYVYLHQLI